MAHGTTYRCVVHGMVHGAQGGRRHPHFDPKMPPECQGCFSGSLGFIPFLVQNDPQTPLKWAFGVFGHIGSSGIAPKSSKPIPWGRGYRRMRGRACDPPCGACTIPPTQANNFIIEDEPQRSLGAGCFPQGALLNHSCRPNAGILFYSLHTPSLH